MAEKKSFLLRLNPDLWIQLQRLADADMRSVNSEIEYLLREAVQKRIRASADKSEDDEVM